MTGIRAENLTPSMAAMVEKAAAKRAKQDAAAQAAAAPTKPEPATDAEASDAVWTASDTVAAADEDSEKYSRRGY